MASINAVLAGVLHLPVTPEIVPNQATLRVTFDGRVTETDTIFGDLDPRLVLQSDLLSERLYTDLVGVETGSNLPATCKALAQHLGSCGLYQAATYFQFSAFIPTNGPALVKDGLTVRQDNLEWSFASSSYCDLVKAIHSVLPTYGHSQAPARHIG